MDVAAWLQSLGLERYVPAFRDNEIDWEVLPKLTSEDLQEIGVAAVGHRRKLLDAIAALGAPASVVDTLGPEAETTETFASRSDAERRQRAVRAGLGWSMLSVASMSGPLSFKRVLEWPPGWLSSVGRLSSTMSRARRPI